MMLILKLGAVTKIDKKNTTTLKNLMMTSCQQVVTPFSFFQLAARFEQPRSWIPYAWSVIFKF